MCQTKWVRSAEERGGLYMDKRFLEESIEAYTTCTQVDPAYRSAWSNLCGALFDAGRLDDLRATQALTLEHDTGDLSCFIKNYRISCAACGKICPVRHLVCCC